MFSFVLGQGYALDDAVAHADDEDKQARQRVLAGKEDLGKHQQKLRARPVVVQVPGMTTKKKEKIKKKFFQCMGGWMDE